MITLEVIHRPPLTSCPSLIPECLELNPSHKHSLVHLVKLFGRHGLPMYSAQLGRLPCHPWSPNEAGVRKNSSISFFKHLSCSLDGCLQPACS